MNAYAIVGDSDNALVEALLDKAALIARTATVAELDAIGVTLVLAFGSRAASALVPDFRSMVMDRGKAVLGASGKWVAVALGDRAYAVETVTDLTRVETLLLCDGLVELMQPAPPRGWPAAIAFLTFSGERKTARCMLCGKGGGSVGAYNGEGLAWKLCERHAWQSADWAATHLAAMREHADIATADATAAKFERTATRMQAELLGRKGA